MASAFSTPLNYQDNLNITDVAQYSGSVQRQLQQKYDVNLAKIQDIVGQISSAPLIRDKDKEYLGNRLQQMLANVDAGSKINLTDSTAVGQINNYIYGAIDDYTKQQIDNSQKVMKFNSEMAVKREKEPKLYNDKNLAYAYHKAGYDSYVNGTSDNLGQLNYSNFIDRNSVLDELKKIKELKGDQTIQIRDGAGQIIEKKIDGLSEREIYSYMPGLLSSDILNQLKIDGWAKYKDNMPQAKLAFEKYSNSKITTLQDQIEEAQSTANNSALSKTQRDKARTRLQEIKTERQDTEDFLKTIDVENPEQVGYFLEKGAYEYSLAKIASGRESISYKKDDFYFDKIRLELDIEKNQRDAQKDALDLELKQADLRLKGQEFENNKSSLSGVAGGSGNSNAYVGSPLASEDMEENPNFLKKAQENHIQNYNTVVKGIWQAYTGDNTTEEQRQNFSAILARKGFVYNGQGQLAVIKGKENIAKNYSRASVATEAFAASKISDNYKSITDEVNNAELKATALSQEIATVNNQAFLNKFKENPSEYIDQLKNAKAFVQSGHTPEIRSVNQKIDRFVTENGGWKDLGKNLEKNPQKIRQMAEYIDESNKAFPLSKVPFLGSKNLLEEVAPEVNKLFVQRAPSTGSAFIPSLNQFNVTNKKERESLINLIPQDGDNSGASFSDESPMTIIPKANGTIELRQNKGIKTNVKGESVSIPAATTTVQKGTALYNYLTNVINANSNNAGLDATVSRNAKITPYVQPEFIDLGSEDTLNKVGDIIKGMRPEVVKEFIVNPLRLLTEKDAKDTFKAALQTRMPKEDLDYILPLIKKNLNYYDLTVKPIDGVWGAEIKSNINDDILKKGKFTQTSHNLDKDMLNISRNYPQLLILNSLLKKLYDNPDEARTIIRP